MKELKVFDFLYIENIKDVKLVCLGEKSNLYERQILSCFNLNNNKNKIFANAFKGLFSYIRSLDEELSLLNIIITMNNDEKIEFNVFDMLLYKTVIDDRLISLFACTLDYLIENNNIDIMVYNHNQEGYISKMFKQETKRGGK